MKKPIFALALAASLLPLSVAAQQAGMGEGHHPGSAHGGPPAASGTGEDSMPMMRGMPMMQGMGMGSGMMMNCPMTAGGMSAGMGAMTMNQPAGDQGVASLALNAVNAKMHRDMSITFTGNVDADFVQAMIAHHQGAIDMAKVVKAFGSDSTIRDLADAIIEAQEGEIAMMRTWLSENAPQ